MAVHSWAFSPLVGTEASKTSQNKHAERAKRGNENTMSEELKQQFDQDGYIIIREFMTGNEFTALQSEIDRYISDVVPTLPDTSAFYHDKSRSETLKQLQHMQVDPFFDDYRYSPKWTDLAATLIGEPVDPQGNEWFAKPPGTLHPTPPHQDNFYFCLKPCNVATMWLALDKVDEENGCLRYVPGSHKLGIRPHSRTKVLGFSQGIVDYGEQDRAKEIVVTLEPGDLAVHHGAMIHRAEPNRSTSRLRRAFALVCYGKSATRDAEAFARYNDSLKSQHSEIGLGSVS